VLATRKPIILYLESVSFLSFLCICRALDLNLSTAYRLDRALLPKILD
jgi:hypothetical protein